jgi:hypothetical protein
LKAALQGFEMYGDEVSKTAVLVKVTSYFTVK